MKLENRILPVAIILWVGGTFVVSTLFGTRDDIEFVATKNAFLSNYHSPINHHQYHYHPLNPLISVCMPVYDASNEIEVSLRSVLEQTYDNLEIILSLDPCHDIDQTLSIIHQIKAEVENEAESGDGSGKIRILRIYEQPKRLGWIDNMNFAYGKATGGYVGVMLSDDRIPNTYFQNLYSCLQNHPKAVNCYPLVVNKKGVPEGGKSITGTITERIWTATETASGCQFKGLQRVPYGKRPWKLPKLYLDYAQADQVQAVLEAIEGELVLEKEAIYYKSYGNKTMIAQMRSYRGDDWTQTEADKRAYEYNAAAMYVNSSYGYYKYLQNLISTTYNDLKPIKAASKFFDEKVANHKRVAILGAGIQGCMMALLFAKYGYDVTIYDKSDAILNRASYSQEGKVHMGFVYSNDKTLKTGKHMLASALRFAPYIEYLLGKKLDWHEMKSTKFEYLVPYDSIVPPTELNDFFLQLEREYQNMTQQDPSIHYLGMRPDKIFERISLPSYANTTFFEAAFGTEEYAVSQLKIHKSILEALEDANNIRLFLNTYVDRVRRLDHATFKTGKFRVYNTRGEHDVDIVVNCFWEGRRVIDDQMGLSPWSGDNLRLKMGFISKPPPEVSTWASATIVNGPYGDFTRFPNDNKFYFTWYPVSRYGFTTNMTPPTEWDQLASGIIPQELFESMIKKHEEQFNLMFPQKSGRKITLPHPKLIAGFIIGNGNTDIDDQKSPIHLRHDDPIRHQEGYFSISTQKYTSGPYNAYLLEQQFLKVQ